MLSDKGWNVDGETISHVCSELHIEKSRTSGYHAQGNGFAERSIRNVREVLRSALLDRGLQKGEWRKIPDSVIFALNSSVSKAMNCTPFEVVFGRKRFRHKACLYQWVYSRAVYQGPKSAAVGDNKTHLEIFRYHQRENVSTI